MAQSARARPVARPGELVRAWRWGSNVPANTDRRRSGRASPRLIAGIFVTLLLTWSVYCAATAAQAPPAGGDAPAAPPESPASEAANEPDSPGRDAQYVGTLMCSAPACHGGMMDEFGALRHSHFVSDPRFGEAAGCEVCHGPASNHVIDPDHRRIYRFTLQNRSNSQRLNAACLVCHQETIKKPHFGASEHARAGLSCATCHEVHFDLGTPYLLRYPGVGGPAGRPLPPNQWILAAREASAHARAQAAREAEAAREQTPPSSPSPPAPEGGAAPPATATPPETPAPRPSPMPPSPGTGAAGPAAGDKPPGSPEEALALPFWPKLAALAKRRIPIPNWKTSYPREPTAITKDQAINETCASCHRRTVTEFRQFSHHPLFEDRANCTGCHDPHHALDGRMLRKPTIAETCLQCHQNLRGPFVFEHEPVKAGGVSRDCLECHRPHGAPNRKLEVMFSRGLCVQCHTDIQRDPAHQTRRGDCWRAGCHVAVHGSNHSFLLFRE